MHPDFQRNRWIYFSYSARGQGGLGTEVARGRLTGYRLEEVQVLFRALPKSHGGRHFGSRLLFGPGGYLYITLGDRGTRKRAQDLADHAGSIIRLYDDGRVPADNPFVNRTGTRPEIFTYGNRNVQGIALVPGTGRIWAHEHGPQGGDEVNIVRGGTNYGWPVITYGRNYVTGTRIGEGTLDRGCCLDRGGICTSLSGTAALASEPRISPITPDRSSACTTTAAYRRTTRS